MSELEFFTNDVCPFVYRVRLALAEKAIVHKSHTIDLLNIPEWYYEISPTGNVPPLKQDDDSFYKKAYKPFVEGKIEHD